MLDLVVVAMALVIPVMAFSIKLVKEKYAYEIHKKIQLLLGIVLLIAVIAFEVEMRMVGWTHLAETSPYYPSPLFPLLYGHILIATSTTVLWILTIFGALKNFSNPPRPNAYSAKHKKLGKSAAVGMTLTAITGWIFYYMAFIA